MDGRTAGRTSITIRLCLAMSLGATAVPVAGTAVTHPTQAVAATVGDTLSGVPGDEFGTAIDRDGAVHVVGGDGVARIVSRTVGGWTTPIDLVVPGGTPASFGRSAAIDMASDGQYGIAVVGAAFDDTVVTDGGSAHVFEYDPTDGWRHVESVVGDEVDEYVGSAVEVQLLDDDRTANVLVGAARPQGTGYVLSWVRSAGVSTAAQVVESGPGGDVGDWFGISIAVDDGTMVVGAFRDSDTGSSQSLVGSASVFDGDAAGALTGAGTMSWVETHQLSLCGAVPIGTPHESCGTSPGEGFGLAVDVRDDLIAVGAPYRSAPGGGDAGSVTVFGRDGTDWSLVTNLYHADAGPTDRLGFRVAIEDRLIVSSAYLRNSADGAVLAFFFDGVAWFEYIELVREGTGTAGGQLGHGLAVDGTAITAGSPFNDFDGVDAGEIVEYVTTVPPADYPPVAVDDVVITWPSDPTPLDVLANDEDPEGTALSVTAVADGPANGSASVTDDGSAVDYVPDPGFVGTDTFGYTATDGFRTADATVTVEVLPEIRIDDVTVDESDGIVGVPVSVTAAPAGLTFDVVVTPGTAVEGDDYTAGLTSLTIEPGGLGVEVPVELVDDDVAEDTETLEVSLAGVPEPFVVVDGAATLTILDTDTGSPPDPGEIDPPPTPPVDDGPTASDARDQVADFFDDLTAWWPELAFDLPDLPELPELELPAWPSDLPPISGPDWDAICDWLSEHFDLIDCDTPGGARTPPGPIDDDVVIQQGTTRAVNIGRNDVDDAGRPIFVRRDVLPNEEQSPTGLDAVEVDSFGNATITAAGDYVGATSFRYRSCTADDQCAMATVHVDVIEGPVPPSAQPDEVTLRRGEQLSVNVLANDDGDLTLTQIPVPDSGGEVVDTGPIAITAFATGDLVLTGRLDDPPLPEQDATDTYFVPYEACDASGTCTTSTLTIVYGGVGPDLDDDRVPVGPRRTTTAFPLRNDIGDVRITDVVPLGDAERSLADDPLTWTDDTVEISVGAHPGPEFTLRYTACLVADPTYCSHAVITAYTVDREEPIARPDVFVIPRRQHLLNYRFDVLGPGGGGADTTWDRPVGFDLPGANGLALSWVDDRGTPDESDDEEIAFAVVTPLDPVNQTGTVDELPRLLLSPLTQQTGDSVVVPEPPPAGTELTFGYRICDVDPDLVEAAQTDIGTLPLDLELCDETTVTLIFVEDEPLAVPAERTTIGLLPGEAPGSWVAPSTIYEIDLEQPPELRHLYGENPSIGITSDIDANIEVEVIATPPRDPVSGRAHDAAIIGTFEVPGADLGTQSGLLVFEPPTDPIDPGADTFYELRLTDDAGVSGTGTSVIGYRAVDFRPVAVVRSAGLFSETVDLGDAWATIPAPNPLVPTPEITIDTIAGEPAVSTFGPTGEETLWGEDRGDYRLEVLRSEDDGPIDRIRIVPDEGIEQLVLVPYRACARWDTSSINPQSVNPAAVPYTLCRDSFVVFDVDTQPSGLFGFASAMSARTATPPWDPGTDPWVEFTIEQRLDEVLPTVADTAAGFGASAFAELADLFDVAGLTVDGSFTGAATVLLTAGVDSEGPYVDGATTLTVHAAGGGTAFATPSIAGADATVETIAGVQGELSVRLGEPGERLRVGDPAAFVAGLDLAVDYDVIAAVQLSAGAGIVRADPHAVARLRPSQTGAVDVDTTVVVPVRVEIPGAEDGDGEPVVVETTAQLLGAGALRIDGTAQLPPGSAIDGFGLADVTVALTVDADGITGSITADVQVPALADATEGGIASTFPVRIDIEDDVVTGVATTSITGLEVGTAGAPFLAVGSGTVVATVTGDLATGTFDLALDLDAPLVEILPGNPTGSATLTGVAGSLSSSGPATLTFASLTAGTDELTGISTGAGQLTIGDGPNVPILVLTDVTALDTQGVSVTIGRIEFYADGRVIVSDGCLASEVGLAETIGLAGVLPFDVISACLDGGVVTVDGFFDFELLEDLPFTPTITIGTQTVGPQDDPIRNRFLIAFDATTLEPIDLGPIRIGIEDLGTDGVTASGFAEIAGWSGGVFDATIAGSLDVTGTGEMDALPIGGAVGVDVVGELTVGAVAGELHLSADVGATGFIGEYLELVSGELLLAVSITVPTDLVTPPPPGAPPITVDGPRLESAALTGVVRIPGLESDDDTGGIPVTVGYEDRELVAEAGGGATYRAGPVTLVDTTGTVRIGTTAGVTAASGTLSVGSATIEIGGVVEATASPVELVFDGLPGTPLLRLDNVAATIADPTDGPPLAELTVDFVEIGDDGSLALGIVEATSLERIADRFGFGDLLPVTLTGLRIDPTDPTAVTATVAGEFDSSELEALLPGDDVAVTATLGDAASGCDDLGIDAGSADTFCFTIALHALGDGGITPIAFGPLTLDIEELEVSGSSGHVSFTIGGYGPAGFDGAFEGSVDVATDLGGQLAGDFSAQLTGELTTVDGAALLELVGTVDASLAADAGGAALSATFRMTVERASDGTFTVTGPSIDDVDVTACIELPGFSSGPDCDGVVARVTVAGDVWTAAVGGDEGTDVTVGGLAVEGANGTLTVDVSDPDAPVITGVLGAGRVTGLLGGVVQVEATPVEFLFDADPDTPVLNPLDLTGRLFDGSGTTDDDVLAQMQVLGFRIADDGTIDVDEIRATELDAAAAAIGIADLLPVVLSGISITLDGDDVTSPDAVTIRVAGTFDLSAIADLSPVVEIGGSGDCDGLGVDPGDVPEFGGTFCFGVRIDEDGVRPVGLGPISLGIGVAIGPFDFSGSLQLGGYDADGTYLPVPEEPGVPGGTADVRGTLTAAVDGDAGGAEIAIVVSGDFGLDSQGRTTLELDGSLEGGFQVQDVIVLEGATVTFGLGLALDTSDGFVLSLLDAKAHSLSADVVKVGVPGLFTIRAVQPSFPLEEGILLRIPGYDPDASASGGAAGSVGLYFGDATEDPTGSDSSNPLSGWGGEIGGFEVGVDGQVYLLDDFGVVLTAGDVGFPDYLPITIDELGMTFGGTSAADVVAALDEGERLPLADLVDQLRLRGSMSISGTSDLPVDGSVDGLEIDIGLLRAWFASVAADERPGAFFVTNLDGLFFGVDELEIASVEVSGGLGVGVARTDDGPRFWARILGGFVYQGYGFGIDVLVSEYGPLSIDVTAPAAMVLGQTGIVVAVTGAGISFNSAPPSICTDVVDGEFDCDDGDPDTTDPVPPAEAAAFRPSEVFSTEDDIAREISKLAAAVTSGNIVSVLPDSFGIFVTGQVSHLAVAAYVQGEIELALYLQQPATLLEPPGVKMVGRADISVLGMSLGNVVLYADYADQLAPAWTIAGAIANGGDLLDLLFPIGSAQAFTLDTEGLAAATILGMRELILGLIDGTLSSPALEELFAEPLDALIEDLRRDPHRRLRQVLFGDVPDEDVTLDTLRARLLDVLPGPAIVDGEGTSEIGLLLQNAAQDSDAALAQLTLAVDVAGALFADLTQAVLDGEVEVVDGVPVELTQEQRFAKGQQIIAAFQELLSSAPGLANQVGQVVYDVADPALVGQGRIQFELFDIPIGEPALDSVLVIDKEGVFVQFDGSIAKLTATAASFANAAGTILIPLTLLVSDQTSFGLSFPFRFDDFLAGEPPDVFDPRTGEWALTTGSDLYLLGMEVSSVDGIVVPAGSDEQVAAWELANERIVPSAGGPNGDVDARAGLVADGGLYVVGTLAVPEMLADPIGWYEDAAAIVADVPEDLLALPGYLGDAGETLFATRPGGRFELFTTAPNYDPSVGPPTEPAAWTWGADPYVTAEAGVDLLGYRLVDGSLEVTEGGLVGEIEFPFFGAPLRATVQNVVLTGQDAIEDAIETGDASLDELVRWPTIAVDEMITIEDVRRLLSELGIDDPIPSAVGKETSVRIRGFSPAHHLTADDPAQVAIDDPIRVTGGFEIVLDASVSDRLDDGNITITVGFAEPGASSPTPSFVRIAAAADVLDLGAVTLTDAELITVYDADSVPSVDVRVDGALTIDALDRSFHVEGSLSGGVLEVVTPTPIVSGGLTLRARTGAGGPGITLRRLPNGDVRAELSARITISGWSGSATIDTIVGTGDAALAVVLDGFGRSGIELDGTVTVAVSSRGFLLDLAGGRLSVAALGLQDVSVSGRITQAGVESLSVADVEFDLGPGTEIACADLSIALDGDLFRISGSAGISVVGLAEIGAPGAPGVPGVPGGSTGGGKSTAPAGCQHGGFEATIDLTSNGLGQLSLVNPELVLIGGVTVGAGSATVVRGATKTSLVVQGSVSVLDEQRAFSTDASFTIGTAGLTGSVALAGSIPDLFGWELLGELRLAVSPTIARFELTGSVRPPFAAGGLTVGPGTWIGLGTNPDFSIHLAVDQLTFAGDALQLDGDFSVVRSNGLIQLRADGASIAIPGFADVAIGTLILTNTGSFVIEDLVIGTIGTSALRLTGARLDASRSGADVSFTLRGGVVSGSALNGQSIPLGSITAQYSAATSFTTTFTTPGLDLGPALRFDPFTATVEVTGTELRVQQSGSSSASVLGSPVSLRDLDLRYRAGIGTTVDGTLEGAVVVLGRSLAGASFELGNDGPHLRLDLEVAVSMPIGALGGVAVGGWVRSDGRFSFSGNGTFFGGAATGTISVSFDQDGPTAAFGGTVTIPAGTGSASGRLASNDVLTGTVAVPRFDLFGNPIIDPDTGEQATTTFGFTLPPWEVPAPVGAQPPPSFTNVPGQIVVTAKQSDPALIVIDFTEEVQVANATTVTCSPSSGSLFPVGATTTVTCIALGPGGIADASFDVIVSRRAPQRSRQV